tara:strand:+ start:809 stop:1228 length:420 start_codon:yes stop_codon:yes gene_type:complete
MSAFNLTKKENVGDSPLEVKNGVIQPKNEYSTSNFVIGGIFEADEILMTSDKVFKSGIKDITKDEMEKLNKIAPKQYYLKTDKEKVHYGFIAQDFEKIFPNLVMYKQNGKTKVVNYLEMIPLLLMKIQRMQHEIDELKK